MKTRLFFVSLSFGCVSSFVNNYCPTTKETRKISILGSALWSSQLPTIEQVGTVDSCYRKEGKTLRIQNDIQLKPSVLFELVTAIQGLFYATSSIWIPIER